MKDTDKIFCSILLDVLAEKGVRDIVCSPGSRNAPLLIGAAARDIFRKHLVVDERSAAFNALGISLVSKKPVALICTSGTALLNYAPGVAEAYYQGIPLIVISADRPPQWIDQDDSQTLRQNGALDNFVKKSYTLPSASEQDQELQWFAGRIVNDAFITATSGKPGPVHLNVPLGEPLGRKSETSIPVPRLIDFIQADSLGNKEILRELAQQVAGSKVLLVAGFLQPDSVLQKAVSTFVGFPNVVVMAETISNLHLEEECYSVDSSLAVISPEKADEYAPDLVISIGGALVSRKLKEYLRRNSRKCRHWAIGYSHTTSDPFMALDLRLEVEPSRFFRGISSALSKCQKAEKEVNFKDQWKALRSKAKVRNQEFLKSAPWSEISAFNIILNHIPQNSNLFLSNGTAIRYAQIIPYPVPHASYCNRGVSGIDGSISTAVGGAKAYKGITVMVTGDLSMAYDIGALSLAGIPENFKLIVIDNQGGGIFRFIPSTSSLPECEEFFCMPPNLPLKELAKGYGWNYFEAYSEESLINELNNLFSSDSKAILKVSCPGKSSAEILRSFLSNS